MQNPQHFDLGLQENDSKYNSSISVTASGEESLSCLCIGTFLPAFGGWDQTAGKLRGKTVTLQLDLN